MKFILVVAMVLFLSSNVVADEGAASAQSILDSVHVHGAQSVLRELWSNQKKFDWICSQIETGQQEWLNVARELKSTSDAAASLSLDYSVARAIPNAPIAVLRLVGRNFTVKEICTTPFIEESDEVVNSYLKRAESVLSGRIPPDLEEVRKNCLGQIRTAMK